MKTKDLEAQGLTKEQIDYVMAEMGKALKKVQDDLTKAEEERDSWEQKANNATATLKNFEGIEPDKIQKELEEWKEKAQKAEEDFNKKILERDFNDKLNEELGNYKFSSEAAKKSVIAEIKSRELSLSKGKIVGLTDVIDEIKAEDASAFIDEAKEKQEQSKPRFTGEMSKNQGGSNITREQIMDIKDRGERRRAIAENMVLFENN